MGTTVTKTIDVDIDVDLEDFDEQELIDELDRRGWSDSDGYVDPYEVKLLMEKMYDASKSGNKELLEQLTHKLYWTALGKMV